MLLKMISMWPSLIMLTQCWFCLNMAVNFGSGTCFPMNTIFGYVFLMNSSYLREIQKSIPCIEETVTSHSFFVTFPYPSDLGSYLENESFPPVRRMMQITKQLDHQVCLYWPLFLKDLSLNWWKAKMCCTWHMQRQWENISLTVTSLHFYTVFLSTDLKGHAATT